MAGVLQHPTASQRTGRSSADQPAVTDVLTECISEQLGVAVLRTAWCNLDLLSGVALIGAGAFTVLR